MSTHRYTGGVISATPPTASVNGAVGVWTLEEALRNIQAGTWPNGSGSDPYFKYVTMLLHGDGTNGAQNNTFLDSSSNNFTVTRNGNATQGAYTPYFYPGCWSDFYATTSSGWQTPANSITSILGSTFSSTATFTVEAWIYPLSRHSGGGAVLGYVLGSLNLTGANADWAWGPDSNGNLVLFWYQGGNQICKSTNVVPLNTWTHVALSVSSGSIKLFINGNLETTTGATTINLAAPALTYVSSGGYLYGGTTWQGFNGYVSNLRVVKSTALYTSTFTPSTAPLTAITNTTLLTCNGPRFADQSSLANTLTTTGSVAISKFSSFSPMTPYVPDTYAGSAYFDGTGDFLSNASAAVANFGTGDFTWEAWIYAPVWGNISTQYMIFEAAASSGAFQVYRDGSGAASPNRLAYGSYGASGNTILASSSVPVAQWFHLAISRASSSTKCFVNGTLVATISDTTNYSVSGFNIGSRSDGSNGFPGYISNLRVVKGTAVYTANFTPPTTPVTAITNTSLLLNASNGGIYDNATVTDLETVGNAQINTSIVKYGTGSIAFDGTGDYLVVKDPTGVNDYAFGTGDFTIEMWIYPTAGTSKMLYDSRVTTGVYPTIYINASNAITFYTNGADRITGAAPTLNTWQHIAVVRYSGVTKLYVNGTQSGSSYTDANVYLNAAARPVIGADGSSLGSQNYAGYMDDIRVTKGYARYTTNFTPPVSAFANF